MGKERVKLVHAGKRSACICNGFGYSRDGRGFVARCAVHPVQSGIRRPRSSLQRRLDALVEREEA